MWACVMCSVQRLEGVYAVCALYLNVNMLYNIYM